MRAVRRINNNVAVCEDASGMEVIAMGKGIGFGELPRELGLSEIERTFYEVDANLVSGMTGVSPEVFSLAVKVADRARQELDDEFSPNLAFTLADHIAFAIRRAKENVRVRMPLACDVEQSCPGEYRIARQTLRLIERELGYHLSEDEAAGIAGRAAWAWSCGALRGRPGRQRAVLCSSGRLLCARPPDEPAYG